MGKCYYITEESGKEFNALTKAREDVNHILDSLGWERMTVHRKKENQNKLIHYLRMGFLTPTDWKKIGQRMETDGVLLIQFPILNSLFFNNIAAGILEKTKVKKNIKIIVLIHDLDSIRFPGEKEKQENHEKNFWDLADVIIVHNYRMKEYLQKQGVQKPMIELGIFDYLMEKKEIRERKSHFREVVIAGNLNGNKTQYLRELRKLKTLDFRLYGPGFEEGMKDQNVVYKGVYPPDQLPDKIRGGWGLIWDGSSLNGCQGNYGEYLKYNNPHKTSFYLAMEMPVIIWKKAAMARFVEENQIGITVDSLEELPDILNQISYEKYKEIAGNTRKISEKIRAGKYLEEALKESRKYV
ncbi:MAG TPA: hypothetical protein H9738_12220 [Candidatus Blautia pullistercoris]|uniref:Beta-1,6-galactofuranosyltransferase WbbI n=1 Tax=Candidatus Blautia pullistercoris TaxID=2838499 RepID=A0A9D1VND0_9FIRM|nr:hypothetical protein [Candidatus Blautia pullistercoris]